MHHGSQFFYPSYTQFLLQCVEHQAEVDDVVYVWPFMSVVVDTVEPPNKKRVTALTHMHYLKVVLYWKIE